MTGRSGQTRQTTTAEVRLDQGKATSFGLARRATRRFGCQTGATTVEFVAARLDETENHAQQTGNPGNVGLSMARQMDAAPDPFRFVLGQPMVAVPGEDWHYNKRERLRDTGGP
jgi:hypothetical protein